MLTDNHCRYDKQKHRYILTAEYMLEVRNIDLYEELNTSGSVSDVAKMPDVILDRVSSQIYSYIYANSAYTFRTERELALNDKHRPHLIEAMAEQVIYTLNNGDISAYSGVNAVSGMSIDPHRMRMAEIAPMAKSILEARGLIGRGIQPCFLVDDPTYEQDGY